MNRLQVIDLFDIIKRTYPSFDSSLQNIEHYAKYLEDFPYEPALEHVERHIRTERFPPTIADIRGRLGDQLEGKRSKEEASAYFMQLDEWKARASAPPEGYWERVKRQLRGI